MYNMGMFALILVSLLVGLIFYWSFKPYNILAHEIVPYELVKDTYKTGEKLEYRVKFCKYTDDKAVIFGSYINGVIKNLPAVDVALTGGCYEVISNDKVLPEELTPGPHRYCETIIYHVNPIRDIPYTFCTESFLIIE